MYESNQGSSGAPQRQRKGRRRALRRRRVFIGAAMVMCLLTCAGQALGEGPTLVPAVQTTEQPKSVEAELETKPQAVSPPYAASMQPAASVTQPAAAEDWRLLLVNPWNPLPDDFAVSLTKLKNGHSVDQRCYPDLQAMLDDCRAAGLKPVICSSYRTQETQERLFRQKVSRYLNKGYSEENARAEAGKFVAVPGTSEHQLGLAVDIVDLGNQNLNKSQEETAVQKWLMEHSWQYGFILRYPNEKTDITGIVYEPWHYRFVGKEAAKEIYERGISLEEYLTPQ